MHLTLVSRRAINATMKISCVWKFCILPRRKSAHYPWDTAANGEICCSHNWHMLRYIVIIFALLFHPLLLITTSHTEPLKLLTPYDVQLVLCSNCLQDGRLHWLILHDELRNQSPPSHPYVIHCSANHQVVQIASVGCPSCIRTFIINKIKYGNKKKPQTTCFSCFLVATLPKKKEILGALYHALCQTMNFCSWDFL